MNEWKEWKGYKEEKDNKTKEEDKIVNKGYADLLLDMLYKRKDKK